MSSQSWPNACHCRGIQAWCLAWISFWKMSWFQAKAQSRSPGWWGYAPQAPDSPRSSKKTGFLSTTRNKSSRRTGVFLVCGLFFSGGWVFSPPANPTGDTDRKLNFCCFDFCSFSPCPAETLRTRETKEPLTCLAAPALPFLLEHTGRLQQLRERGPSVFRASPQSQETVAESDSVLGLGLATNADTALQH